MLNNRLNDWGKSLEKRKQEGTLRVLRPQTQEIDFYSNDYLGLARNRSFQNRLLGKISENPRLLTGSTGSRLISGHSIIVSETEEYIAKEHQFPCALLFSSGYNANLSLFSTLLNRHDTLIIDEQIHRSVHDGCGLSNAKKIKFKHNDLQDLEDILKRQKGGCYVAVETLYSMDGDIAPIEEIVQITEKYNANLIVDEAHAFGVFGYGMIEKFRLQDKVMTVVVTYGKALGTHGAAILCNKTIRSYLINFASPFIYTTSSHDFLWMSIKEGYEFLKQNHQLAIDLQENIKIFRKQNVRYTSSEKSPIQAILIPENNRLRNLKEILFEKGMLTYAVFSPAVKTGTERLRICLHSFNTRQEIVKLSQIIQEFNDKNE
ncbi:pyridoxal phosphate-dependent aminotransferase family protein [Chryseobacterium nematophagum]|uniref:Pyridoxal phosphate-dependent aminotransferase family protein n=1 Tax=Chryseobacterium nematophagum TaxID=2305228 RepID=A0A3M7LD62_9FLAO|nr:pyridoxal phosphate-dependent aminotransferase family protein [Chryseobacterium nematophagum]RMZ60159.1 pyridoxal phosphate-dependent aminotransferase family protein [Chryseobacterium nematophagum]